MTGATAYVLCVTQAYISMYEYKDSISSACLNCSYLEDVLTGSLFAVLFFIIVYSLFLLVRFLLKAKKQKTNHKAIMPVALYAVACFMVDHEIFVSRETSWSTFATLSELAGTLQKSYITIFITTLVFYLIIRKLFDIYQNTDR